MVQNKKANIEYLNKFMKKLIQLISNLYSEGAGLYSIIIL